MNPPFHLQKRNHKKLIKDVYDYDFVKKAFSFLQFNAVLVAITGRKYKDNPDKLTRFANLYPGKKSYEITCQENCYQPSTVVECESPGENCRFVGKQLQPEVNTGFTFRWLGHASFYLKSPEGSTLLLDPVSKQFDWPVDWAFRLANGFFRKEPKWLLADELNDVDAVLYSHIHYDHFNKDDIENIATNAQYLVPLGFGEHFPDGGYNINEMAWFSTAKLAELNINFVPAHHFMRIMMPHFGAVGLSNSKVNGYFLRVIRVIQNTFKTFNSVMVIWMSV